MDYRHLGPFSDLVAAAGRQGPLYPSAGSPAALRQMAREVLAFSLGDEQPADLQENGTWQADGIVGTTLSWSVGYGPRTEAWLLRPAGRTDTLPGAVALHDHGHFKFFGKEKIADGPDGADPRLAGFRALYYGGRGFANHLAREGFAVLVPDTFLWGSRRFPLETMPEAERALAGPAATLLGYDTAGAAIAGYNGAAYMHEHLVAKYCTILGTSFAALVAYEDRVALNVLRRLDGVDPRRIAAIGLSGGGARAALLRATAADLGACVIAGMMSTYDGLLDHDVAPHTWMLFPPGLPRRGDWPDLAASGAPDPLLIQYLLDDPQFTEAGMRGADARIAAQYAAAGRADGYRGEFYPGPHRFDEPMQRAAFAWLGQRLSA